MVEALDSLCTVVITTSPTPSNPSTEMMEIIFKSFSSVLCDVESMHKVIICDGYIVDESAERSNKLGRISSSHVSVYKEYCEKLQELASSGVFMNTRVIIQEQRQGFARNVRLMLEHLATPYIFVYQHDWSFQRPIDLGQVLECMVKHDNVHYVGFPNCFTNRYPRSHIHKHKQLLCDLRAQLGSKINGATEFEARLMKFYTTKYGAPIVPLHFWFDRPHIARVTQYLSVLRSHHVRNYIEDCVGQALTRAVREGGLAAHAHYGTYLWYDDPGSTVLYHMDGRKFLNKEQRQALQSRRIQKQADNEARCLGHLQNLVLVTENLDVSAETDSILAVPSNACQLQAASSDTSQGSVRENCPSGTDRGVEG